MISAAVTAIGYASAAAFNPWLWFVSIGCAVALSINLARRQPMRAGKISAFAVTSAITGLVLSVPTWLITLVVACHHGKCPFS